MIKTEKKNKKNDERMMKNKHPNDGIILKTTEEQTVGTFGKTAGKPYVDSKRGDYE